MNDSANITQFFGYGALSSRQVIKEIIGRDPGRGTHAIIRGYQLAYQVLDQVNESVRPFLRKIWGDSFRAYTLRKGSGFVSGVLWDVTEAELAKIKTWSFVGSWRELVHATADTPDGRTVPVLTEKVPDTQPIKETVDGLRYEMNLNHEGKRPSEPDYEVRELEYIRRQLKEMAYGNLSAA